ncbi:MAG TPA: ABC transporter permease, partial [Thermotogota bacterium]|nr:ABC transporter permease [Thermotogota bacterium]
MPIDKVTTFQRVKNAFSVLYGNKTGFAGFLILCFFLFIAVFGPFIKPYDIMDFGGAEDILRPPSFEHLLGTDDMGRDIL